MNPNASQTRARTPKPKRRTLAREIALVLLVKLVLIVAIKLVFFSHPADKQVIDQRLQMLFSDVPTPTQSLPPTPKEHP